VEVRRNKPLKNNHSNVGQFQNEFISTKKMPENLKDNKSKKEKVESNLTLSLSLAVCSIVRKGEGDARFLLCFGNSVPHFSFGGSNLRK